MPLNLSADLSNDVSILEKQTYIYTFAAVVLGFIGFFGFVLNLLIVITVVKNANVLWTPTNVVLVNMVVGDFLVAALGNPFALTSAIAGSWFWSHEIINCYRHAYILAFLVWIYALSLSLPPFFNWGTYGPEAGNISCSVSWEIHDPETHNDIYIGFLFLFGFFLPVIIIISSYCGIIKTLKKIGKRISAKNRREKKVTKMVYLMILAFLIAWSPYAVLALATQYFNVQPSHIVAVLPALLAKSSICYNPIIYATMTAQFPNIWKKMFSSNGNYLKNKQQHGSNTEANLELKTEKKSTNRLSTQLNGKI
ncbi:green-sensitive opsin-like [Temnothorax curvispinosus]|uniref:Green-sensitive opsin-like n=1 Tax=Temnothorax curvispinosus TaxID=300111 RepID=A0A6J1PUE4_9HYME|nr:green-sensitive opsin-like [Temnothorax curvispinosus]